VREEMVERDKPIKKPAPTTTDTGAPARPAQPG
jgi:hypothetical protein